MTQSSRLEIDEAGTTAAAVASFGVALAAPPADKEFEMVVNRPFVLGIQDVTSGAMLFLAAVCDPMPTP